MSSLAYSLHLSPAIKFLPFLAFALCNKERPNWALVIQDGGRGRA